MSEKSDKLRAMLAKEKERRIKLNNRIEILERRMEITRFGCLQLPQAAVKRSSSKSINIFTNGMYLWGLPRINDIQSVNITYPSVTDDVKEISSSEDIELALKLTGFLKYDLFGEVNSEEEPAITITYFLKDGTSKTISANNTTVWWNNKIHVIKDKEMFVNLTEGIFFLEDLQTK